MKKWIKAFRLRTLPLALSCIVAGSGLSELSDMSWLVFTLAISTTLFLQVLSNLANDYGDFVKGADNEDRIGPARALQSGEITESAMKKAVILCAVFALLSGITLLGVSFNWQFNQSFIMLFILGIVGIAAAIKYTVGKFALAYHALGDVFVFLFFGLVGVLGANYLQNQSINWSDFLIAITVGFWSVGVLNMNNMRDHVNDKAQNKNTVVVLMGFNKAKFYQSFLIIGGLFSAVYYLLFVSSSLYPLALVVAIPLISHLRRVWLCTDEKDLNKELKILSLSTFAFSILLLFF